MTEPLAVIHDYDGLIAALRARADEIGLSYNLIDELTGLPSGYVGKLFGPSRVKMVGMDSLWLIAEVLAIEILIVPSLVLAQKMAGRWEQRDELRRRPGVIRKRFSPEVRAKIASEIGRLGGGKPKRFRLSEKQRTLIYRRNGKKGGRPRKASPPPSIKSGSLPACGAASAKPFRGGHAAPSASRFARP